MPFIPKKYLIILAALVVAGVLIWRYEHYITKAAENAYVALTNANTIETTNQSKKDSENVRKEVSTDTDSQLDARLCALSIVQDNGCHSD